MDILRKELNSIYASQHLEWEHLEVSLLQKRQEQARNMVGLNQGCCVVTDASVDLCYIYAGTLGRLIGLTEAPDFCKTCYSSDEDIIYNRMHPEDLVEKRMLEYEFFKHVDSLSESAEKLKYVASCRIRIRNGQGRYIYLHNTTQVLQPSPRGKIWLILCCYQFSPQTEPADGISPCIMNRETGEAVSLSLGEKRKQILSEREKQILRLIKEGKPSKQIADVLGISINTVNRHRQNILEKLSVGNSVEAVTAATAMKLL